ncbi:hypothetical protein BS47DRAFT_1395868 [Hydnum rufescens UP504]|uniref:Uncharacterized protein n=1 Tax=Hydnum rufescens UP504 TaxID=1448309 RepID=A0A9P6ARW5_9AGAM|nr:hypothetical protein BS47DRAFT_1395868 [Hydnum rufescens UP504]
MRDGPWQSASSSKAPTHQPLPQPAWRPSLSPSREYARPGPSQLRRRSQTPPLSSGPPPSRQDPPSPPQPEATPLLSRLGPAPTPFPQGSVAPTASVAPSVSDVSTLWPPPECLRLAQWYALDIAGVDGQEDPLTWVHQNSHLGVLAARRVKPIRKKGAMYHMYLLFKDVAKWDSCRSVLVSSCGGKTLLPFLYMQEVYINAISTAEIQELLAVGPCPYATPGDAIPEMLDYIRYPALLDPRPAPPKHERTRAMISVEFDTEWLSRRLHRARKEDPGSVTVGMRRMEMQMIAHRAPAKGTALAFCENIWPVPGGTMISDIRQISRWAYADLGGSEVRSSMENFGRTRIRPAWRIVLELNRDQPRFHKWIDDPFPHTASSLLPSLCHFLHPVVAFDLPHFPLYPPFLDNRLPAMSGNIVRSHNINSLWWSLVLDSVTIHSLFPAPLKTFHPLHSFYWLLVIFQQTCEVPGLHLPLLPLASLWGFLESLVKDGAHCTPIACFPSAFFGVSFTPAALAVFQLPYTFNPSKPGLGQHSFLRSPYSYFAPCDISPSVPSTL